MFDLVRRQDIENAEEQRKNDKIIATLARAKTLQVMRLPEPIGPSRLVLFLYEAKQLTKEEKPFDLSRAFLNSIAFDFF